MKPIPKTEKFISEFNELLNLFYPAFAVNLYNKENYILKLNKIDNTIKNISNSVSEVKNEFWSNLDINSFDFMIELSRVKFKSILFRYNSLTDKFDSQLNNALEILSMRDNFTNVEKDKIQKVLTENILEVSFILENLSSFFHELKESKYSANISKTDDTGEQNQSNGGRPKTEIDENMTLKSIMYEGLYKEAKGYYQKKMEEGKFKYFYQYAQLIQEFAAKDWITPAYKTLPKNNKQMKILILNEFKIDVSDSSARGRAPGGWNVFKDLEKKYPKTFIT